MNPLGPLNPKEQSMKDPNLQAAIETALEPAYDRVKVAMIEAQESLTDIAQYLDGVEVFCADCGTLMILTGAGHMCPVEDWHDECTAEECGFFGGEGESCGLREGYAATPRDLNPTPDQIRAQEEGA